MPRSTASGRWTGAAMCSTTTSGPERSTSRLPLRVPPLAERHGDRGPAVAHPLGDLLAAVEVTQGGVVDAGEDLGRHPGDATHGDVTLGLAAHPAEDEGVRHDDRAAAADRGVCVHPGHGGPHDAGVGAFGRPQGVGGESRLEVGEWVDRDLTEHHRPSHVANGGADVQTRAFEQPGGEPEPDRRVVVPAGEDDLCAGVDEPHEGVGQDVDGVRGRHRPVVEVTAHEHRVHRLGPHDLDEVVEVGGLGVEQPHLVECPSQVPVGGVDQPHVAHARRGVRHGT